MTWRCKETSLPLGRTLVMGIVNVTPDSFSDGGRFFRPEEAVRRARNCVEEGARIVDLGGESTRPGSTPIGWEEEWKRLEPVLAAFAEKPLSAVVSVDTYHPETAERSLAAGASAVNCVHSEPLGEMVRLVRETGAGLVAPCRNATDLAKLNELDGFAEIFSAGQFLADPEIGFGTTREEDLALMGSLRRLARLAPVCVGVSRKRLIKKLTGEKMRGAGKNVGGSVGAAIWCAMCGAAVVRVHDVKETVQALMVAEAFASAERDAEGGAEA